MSTSTKPAERSGSLGVIVALALIVLFVIVVKHFEQGSKDHEPQGLVTSESATEGPDADNASATATEPDASAQAASPEPEDSATDNTAASTESEKPKADEKPVVVDEPASGSPVTEAETTQVTQVADNAENTASDADTGGDTAGSEAKTDAATSEPVADEENSEDKADATTATASQQPVFELSAKATELAGHTRETLGAQALIDDTAGSVVDDRKTALIGVIDRLVQDNTLVVGIAANVKPGTGTDGYADASQLAQTMRDFFVDNGVEPGRIVAGVLHPDFESADGVARQLEFFFAERM